jgi:transcriptional regulator GlxA family with amidase domain
VNRLGDRDEGARERLAEFVRRLPYVSALYDEKYIDALVEALYDDIRSFHWSGRPVDGVELAERMKLLVDESRRQAPAIQAAMEGFASLVDVSRARVAAPNVDAALPIRALHPGIQKAIEKIAAGYADELDIRQLTESASLGKSQFMAAFKRETGMTPHEYIRRVRVEAAVRLLRSGTDVTRACFEVGFSSLGGFRKAFVELVGMLPSDFQRLNRP